MQSDVERWQYEQREKALRDYLSEIRATRAEGRVEGATEATLHNLRNLMHELSLSPERAMDILHIPAADRPHYLQLLSD